MSHQVSTASNLPTAEAEIKTRAETPSNVLPLVRRRWTLTSDGRFRRTHSCSHLLAA